MRNIVWAGALTAAVAWTAGTQSAQACGGCFSPSDTPQVVTGHRMAMAIHATESILWDQIQYSGSPTDFSWVLPVAGDVRVEVASPAFFDQLEQSTAVTVRGPLIPNGCGRGGGGGFGCGSASAPAAGLATDAPPEERVMVLNQATVGPYETVTLRSTDANALTTWLRSNAYTIPTTIEPTIQFYTDRHMDFIALRLRPGVGVAAMQPVRIRYASANMVLPLRMVGAGVADSVGITLWVFASSRFEAGGGFANGTVTTADLAWDWNTGRSNYTTAFSDRIRSLGGRAWLTEFANSQTTFAPGTGPEAADWNLALSRTGSGFLTRLRTELAARFLDNDLPLQAATDPSPVSSQLNTSREVGTRPMLRCGQVLSVGTAGLVARYPRAAGLAGAAGLALSLTLRRRNRRRNRAD